jgi:SlyX protein
MSTTVNALEEKIAHLERQAEDLSEVVAAQGRDIDRLSRLVAVLTERERAREQEGGGGVILADERPPHW